MRSQQRRRFTEAQHTYIYEYEYTFGAYFVQVKGRKMAAFMAVLEADLRALSSESRRRYPAVKDAAEHAILKV